MVRLVVAVCLLCITAGGVRGQVAGTVDVFLDCQAPGCDDDHIRSEIDWVNWVRDRTLADVHLLVTAEFAGGGGFTYRLSFLGQRAFERDTVTLALSTPAVATGAERRDALTARIGQGLLHFASRTAAADRLRVVFAGDPVGAALPAVPARDPWRSWVFSVRGEVSLDGEARESSHELGFSFDGRRTTRASRIEFMVSGEYEEDRFELRTGEQRFITRDWQARLLGVTAIADRWSIGAGVLTGRSTFENQTLFVRTAPVLEYSFLPYAEFSRRRLVLQYTIGGRHADYMQPTIYGRASEFLFDQELELSAEFRQPWGSARSSISGSHFLHDANRHRLSAEAGFDIRLFRGFTLNVSGEYARVHDQLYLPAGDADDEEILLRRRALETNYEYRTSIGLRYQFGSVYNNIVNPRIRRDRPDQGQGQGRR